MHLFVLEASSTIYMKQAFRILIYEHMNHIGHFLTRYLNADGDGRICIHLSSVICCGWNPLSWNDLGAGNFSFAHAVLFRFYCIKKKKNLLMVFPLADTDKSHIRRAARPVHKARPSLAQAAVWTVNPMREGTLCRCSFRFFHSKCFRWKHF